MLEAQEVLAELVAVVVVEALVELETLEAPALLEAQVVLAELARCFWGLVFV